MSDRPVSDKAKIRLKDLLRGYPTNQGVVYPKDIDKLYKLPTQAEGTVKMGGGGKIQRIEEKPKAVKRPLSPMEKNLRT